jgi:hypothetical protein
MVNINQWLNEKNSKYTHSTNKEYINDVFSILYEWLKMNDKIYIDYEMDEIRKYLYIFIYNKHLFENDSCEIIDMYFTSDIVDLYFDIDKKYGTELLKMKNINVDDLLIFINNVSYFCEDDGNIYEDEEITYLDEIIM